MNAPTFREFVAKLRNEGKVIELKKEASLHLELAGVLAALDGKPVLAKAKEVPGIPVVGNLFCSREIICEYFGIGVDELIPKLGAAIEKPSKPAVIEARDAPVLEVTEKEVDLSKLPIPMHAEKDGGKYFSSAVVIANDKEYGRNCSFHRMMVIGKDKVVARILHRHLEEYINRAGATRTANRSTAPSFSAESAGGELEVAFVVGAPINFLLASATSVELGKDEMGIANALAPIRTVKLPNGIEIPADAEFAFEARVTSELMDEGPFVDLTETYDIVRKQRVMKITKIHHRKGAMWHVLLPGALEHKLLMGMPREPTIFREVSKVAKCRGVNITPGGCSWLHAVVSIEKKNEEDGKKAIEAAFAGHKSLKHVVVVDNDIDIYSPASVEWAIATRVQADKDVVILRGQKGSSLDPSADPNTYATTKMGIDATRPLVSHGKNYSKAEWKKVDVKKYL